jgi:hypothetical protein
MPPNVPQSIEWMNHHNWLAVVVNPCAGTRSQECHKECASLNLIFDPRREFVNIVQIQHGFPFGKPVCLEVSKRRHAS